MQERDNRILSEMRPVDYRRNWKGIVVDYDAVIENPVDTSECWYCLTAPQAQVLMMYAETLRWRTRWINWNGNQEKIEDFANDTIERLIMSCCCDQNQEVLTRVSDDGSYTLQVSYDGGTTWQTDNTDPRLTQPSLPPLPSDTPSLKCQAAWNIRKGFQDAVTAISTVLDVSLTLFAISFAIAGVLAIIITNPTQAYRLIPIVITLAVQIAALSDTDFLAAFSDSDYDALQCAMFCNMNDAGQVSDIGAVLSSLFGDISPTGIPGNAFKLIAYGIGLIGINAMGSTDRGVIGYDCDNCFCGDWCPNEWTIQGAGHGTFNGSGDDEFGHYDEYTSTDPGNGNTYILIATSGNDVCCMLERAELTSGSHVPSGFLWGWDTCGESYTEGVPHHTGLKPTGQCLRGLQMQGGDSTPFTIRVYWMPCA